MSSLVAQMVKSLPAMQETRVWSLGQDSPGEGNGYPLQQSCLENPMDRGAWWATIHGVTSSHTQLSDSYFHSQSLLTKKLCAMKEMKMSKDIIIHFQKTHLLSSELAPNCEIYVTIKIKELKRPNKRI